jgi:hypothetical protein
MYIGIFVNNMDNCDRGKFYYKSLLQVVYDELITNNIIMNTNFIKLDHP